MDDEAPRIPGVRDQLLGLLVAIDSASDKSDIPISLAVGGLVVSGKLIAQRDYLARQGEILGQGTHGSEENEADVRQLLGIVGNRDGGFIHLRDVRVLSGGRWLASPEYWRCHLDQVDGWLFGGLSP